MKDDLEHASRKFRGSELREFQADVTSSHPVRIQLGFDRFGDLVIIGPQGSFISACRCRSSVRRDAGLASDIKNRRPFRQFLR